MSTKTGTPPAQAKADTAARVNPRELAASVMLDPRYLEAHNKWTSLQSELSQVQAAISNERDRRAQRLKERAAALASTDGTEAQAEAPRIDVAKLEERESVLSQAVWLAEDRLKRVRAEVSRETCKKIRGVYLGIIRELYQSYEQYASAWDRNFRFYSGLQDAGLNLADLPQVSVYQPHHPYEVLEHLNQIVRESYGINLGSDQA